MSKFLSRDAWTIHGRVLQEWARCVFNNCLYSLCRPCFSGILGFFRRNASVFVSFGLHANIVEEYVLLSALLHDQSCLHVFSISLCGTLFLEPLFARVVSFHVHVSTRVVSPSLCYVAVSRARENNWDKPLLDVIVVDCLCPYHCKDLDPRTLRAEKLQHFTSTT